MSAPDQSWLHSTRPLINFAEALSFDPSKSFVESPDELSFHNENFKTDKLTLSKEPLLRKQQLAALEGAMREMKLEYGSTLTLQFTLGQSELKIHEDYKSAELEDFCDKVTGSSFEIDLKIDKTELPSHWGITHPSTIFKIFFYEDALTRALSGTLKDLEEGEQPLFQNFTGASKIIILLLDHPIELNGDYLAILGGDHAAKWIEYCPSVDPSKARDRVKRVYDQASTELKRENMSLNYLTPLQLHVEWKQTGLVPTRSDSISCALFAQLVACSVFYMASESRLPKQQDEADYSWFAAFKADKYLAKVDLRDSVQNASLLTDTRKTEAGIPKAVENPFEACLTISELALWSYKEERGVSNRLQVLQLAVASSLQDNKSEDNLQQLAWRAEEILARAERLWDAFIKEKLNKYFSHVKELEETVANATKSYNDHVQTLTTTLIGNMLAAVAVVVGSFLAAIFKSPFQANVFLFGVGIYLVYLLVFPFVIGLVSAWQRFNDSRDVFKKRKADFNKRLGDDEVNSIVAKTVSDRETWFKKWFAVTTVLYAVVLILIVVALVKVPTAIKSWSDDFKLAEVA